MSHSIAVRDREDWLEIPVPALVDECTWQRAQRRLEDNERTRPSHGECAIRSGHGPLGLVDTILEERGGGV